MQRFPALFSLCLAITLSGCSAPPPPHPRLAPLLNLIEQRLDLARSVARYKWQHQLPVQATSRERQVLAQVRKVAADYSLSPERAETFFSDQIEANKLVQYTLLDRWNALAPPPESQARDLADELRPRLDKLQARLLFQLGQLDRQPLADCPRALAHALLGRTNDPLWHQALVRATAQLCQKP